MPCPILMKWLHSFRLSTKIARCGLTLVMAIKFYDFLSFYHLVYMRKCIPVLFLLICVSAGAFAQKKRKPAAKTVAEKNIVSTPTTLPSYPSLLWEITGNGLKKSSWLFGTMHVSDKMVFHLGDSFYHALKAADIVALENNPEYWQEEYTKSIFYRSSGNGRYQDGANYGRNLPNDYLRITSFAIDSYEEAIKAAMAAEPAMINGMMYRTYGSKMDDFEEDTFLDMYIFQVGKKLGKRLTGVENFSESEKLVMEAYRDMMKDRNKKRMSNDFEGMATYSRKLEEAYRKGDLDMLDSLQKLTVVSDAFQEKFLYKRNEIQAHSIDTIIRHASLFVGVGAAHLPGKRGVIEMLRAMGYHLRPVMMDERNSLQKESIDKMRAPSAFHMQTAPDSFYTVSIPGDKFYRFTEWSGMDMAQYADMANGSYYVVNRIKTNHLSWGHSVDLVARKIDSLLYENIPGKILKKTPIVKDGYKGFDITNRTRRGDYQRYQVYITPFEMIVFKISGNGEYVNNGDEAQRFFGSIKLREYNSNAWVSYQPSTGGFIADLPHIPSILKDRNYGTDRLEYAAVDAKTGNSFLIMKANIHNYNFLEEDSFDLNLLNESYSYSSFIDKQLAQKFLRQQGYPALEAKYRHTDGSFSMARYILRGPVYYAVIAHYKTENADTKRFLNSFQITPFIYPVSKPRKDSAMKYTVNSPVFPEPTEQEIKLAGVEALMRAEFEEDGDMNLFGGNSDAQSSFIGNDTTGEKILVTHLSPAKYSYLKDSAALWSQDFLEIFTGENSLIKKYDIEKKLPNGYLSRELGFTDTGSSRTILTKFLYKDGNFFSLSTLTDTLSRKSSFIEQFFSSFTPADSLKGVSQFARKTDTYFKDFFSSDSVISKKARKSLYQLSFDSLDIPAIKSAIQSLSWEIPDYLTIKSYLITRLGSLKDSSVVSYLKTLYPAVKDTVDLQNAILSSLLFQQTRESFIAFKDLLLQDPPLVDDSDPDYRNNYNPGIVNPNGFVFNMGRKYAIQDTYENKWPFLYDSLSLTRNIFPDFLQLIHVDDYKDEAMQLLRVMVDSNYLKAADYEPYFTKLNLDAKRLLKKQLAREDREKMEKSARKDRPDLYDFAVSEGEGIDAGTGNEELKKYAVLLMPFWEKNAGVPVFFEQLMKTRDKELLYDILLLMVRNNKSVPDSLFNRYASMDEYRSRLYEDLKLANHLAKFPEAFKNQKDIARSILKTQFGAYEKMDSLVFIGKQPATYKDRKGFVYFYKYRRMRDDVSWYLASVGMQPENMKEIDTESNEFTMKNDRKLEQNKSEQEQVKKMLKEILYSRHSSASEFYDARSLSIYKTYLSKMVKQGRYKD